MDNTESFVLYESVFKQAERLEKKLGKEMAWDLIKAVMEYGLYAVIPEEDNDIWLYGLEQIFTSIDAAKTRRGKNIIDGSKGGRPAIQLNEEEVVRKKEELKTWKNVASYYKISEDTLRAIRNDWSRKTEKPKNLNVNDNVNVNENVNENVKNMAIF